MSPLAKGGWGTIRANRANPPPSDPASACQVTLQVTYGVGLGGGANRANRGVWGGGALESWIRHWDPVIGHGWPSYVYSDLVGYQTSDIRLLWTITPNPPPPPQHPFYPPPVSDFAPPPPPVSPPISDLSHCHHTLEV